MPTHPDAAHLEGCLDSIRRAPRDAGTVELVVCRPGIGERTVLERGDLDVTLGLVGDTWSTRPSKKTSDGSPHPGMQVTIMSSRSIAAIVGTDRAAWPLAGDNLFVDLDLTDDNLPVGSRLVVGTAIVEVTDAPHNGCAKFTERFGSDASRWLNSPEGRRLKLRGIHVRVVAAGSVATGDRVTVERAPR